MIRPPAADGEILLKSPPPPVSCRRHTNRLSEQGLYKLCCLYYDGKLNRDQRAALTHAADFFDEVQKTAVLLDSDAVEHLACDIAFVRDHGGRLFLIGVGGSAGNCGHAVNDFRKLCGVEAYAATDNVSELTARTNDEGWETVFSAWLKISRLNGSDALFVLSVGGGDAERNVSPNIVSAVDLARERGAKVFGIVGRPNGYTALHGDRVIVIPSVNPAHVTPLSESFQAVVWHCLVSHPALQVQTTKW